jgi:poly(3-hydroxybutyrate) depolymerase
LSIARVSLVVLTLCTFADAVAADTELQRGVIIDRVECGSDKTQTYALYLPSNYSADRQWSVLLAFDPVARGRLFVEKYHAAAEQYGLIVAASNNSRNGPVAISTAAAQAMGGDVSRRFSIDPRRLYLTGLSGGSRVALGIALAGNSIAGVIASSAGFPDSQPRSRVDFPIFGTAGIEDFNYLEMRMLDRKLTSPHYLAVFRGGHELPPDDVAMEAIEWLELQAIQSGRRTRDDALVARLLAKRRAKLSASAEPADTVYLLRALAADFKGLADVSAESSRLDDLLHQREVKDALARDQKTDDAEARTLREIFENEAQLADENRHGMAMLTLRDRLTRLSGRASSEADTPDRSQAIRVLRAVVFGARERVDDREYLELLDQFRGPKR